MIETWINYRNGQLVKIAENDVKEKAIINAKSLFREEREAVSIKLVEDGEIILTYRRERKPKDKKPITRRIDAVLAMNKFILSLNDTTMLLNWSDDGFADYFDPVVYTYGDNWRKLKAYFFYLVEEYARENPNKHILAMIPEGLRECR